VAALSEALFDMECNIEDSRMTILRGHFSVMLVVSAPESTEPGTLAGRLERVREGLGLEALTVSGVNELRSAAPAPTHVITVYGADHPGIVSAISAALADRGVNITDLQTKLTSSGERPIYVMMLEIELGTADAEALEADLGRVAGDAEVEVSIGELETEAL